MRRANGIFETMFVNFSSGLGKLLSHWRYIGVITSAGTTAFTRMPYGRSSAAHSRVSARIAPLDDAYPDVPPWPVTAVLEAILTIESFDFFNSDRAKCAM